MTRVRPRTTSMMKMVRTAGSMRASISTARVIPTTMTTTMTTPTNINHLGVGAVREDPEATMVTHLERAVAVAGVADGACAEVTYA